ncbi:sugar-transfer associated ATP-grasp domain-containing protein [Oceanobacillus sp. CFH 90083]|uniref:sugar-transfer associated ATP-grasp domain-containing protein n=1 Tax=Oceanobacillus sp. CFH 90083 TaxID=2592336 RepID=UPI0018840085|nr:sugar-transfer associated ATP-grasp domain-containing protein [Oceanobacillus sp. CFH 90083]
MSKVNYIKERIRKIKRMMNDFTDYELNLIQKLIILLDMGISMMVYGAGINDYFQYQFYKRKHVDRKTFIVHRKRMKIVSHFNNSNGKALFDSKPDFNTKYKDFIGRDWLDISNSTFEEFEVFVKKHPKFIEKPVDGSHGKGIKIIDLNEENNKINDVYSELKRDNPIIEEIIVQHEELAAFNPTSVNTLRVVTLKCNDGNVRVMTANLRVGNGQKYADNFHHNGIASLLNVDKGIVITSGIDMNFKRYYVHPVSGKQIIGFNIPYWNKVVETCKNAALVTPSVGYVGWDVAIGKEGKIMIIEGNAAADPDVSQMPDQIGKWPLYEPFVLKKKNQ